MRTRIKGEQADTSVVAVPATLNAPVLPTVFEISRVVHRLLGSNDGNLTTTFKTSALTTPRTQYLAFLKTNRLMLFRETVARYRENLAKCMIALCWKNAQFLDVTKDKYYASTTDNKFWSPVNINVYQLEVTFYFNLLSDKELLQRTEATEVCLFEVVVEIRQELNISYLTTLYSPSHRPQATSHKSQGRR